MKRNQILDALPVPVTQGAAKGVPPTQGRALKNWLDSLPLANCAAAAELLNKALQAASRSEIPAERRLDLLEGLRPAVQQVCVTLEKRFLGQSIPLLQRPAHANEQVHGLLQKMALGYRLVMLQLGAKNSVRFSRRRRLALACSRTLVYLGERMLRTYQVYGADPVGLWRQIYASWQWARLHGVSGNQVDDEHCRYRQRRSIDEVLLQILLLALCNPYRLGQREISEVNSAMEVWCLDCELRSGSQKPAAGMFTFCTTDDAPPGILRKLENSDESGPNGPSEDLCCLDARKLAKRLQGKADKQSRSADPVKLEQGSRDRIMMAWGIVAPRGFRRLPARHRLEAIVGLRGVHYAIAGMRDFDTLASGDVQISGQLAHWARTSTEQRTRTTSLCRVVDQSFGGYRLRWDSDQNVRLNVGELLATARPAEGGEQQNWITGVVRWIRSDNDGNLEAGVELLARTAEAVVVFPNPKQRNPANAIRGLLLDPLNRSEPEMSMLITDPSMRDADRMVLADRKASLRLEPEENPQLTLRLIRCVEHTPAFAQFHYQLRDVKANIAQ